MTLPCSPGLDKIIPSREEKIEELRREIRLAEGRARASLYLPRRNQYSDLADRLRRQLSALTGEE